MSAGRGVFVTLEGGEGVGKSTQLTALTGRARASGREVVACREPGGTALGERLRHALFAPDGTGQPPSAEAELLVFAAARAQLVQEVIRPALARGALVLCDRFVDSTVAYQHHGRGLDGRVVEAVNAAATGGLKPDLTVLLDLAPQLALAREADDANYMEREHLDFHERVRAGYLALAACEPQRWLVLDASRPRAELTDEIWKRVEGLL